MSSLSVEALVTRIFRERESLLSFVAESVENAMDPGLLESKVVAVTSKIVSLSEGRVVKRASIDKESLIRQEADVFMGSMGYGSFLTIKEGLLIPSAGVDESNAEGGDYILYPQNPFASAEELRQDLALRWKLNRFGVLLTDSHTTPLRAGVTGIALAHSGFCGILNRVGASDLFGRPLKMTRVNVADALAVAAVLCMGEAGECSPLAVIESQNLEFLSTHSLEKRKHECRISPELDLYAPFLKLS